jgi:hypothetical protein
VNDNGRVSVLCPSAGEFVRAGGLTAGTLVDRRRDGHWGVGGAQGEQHLARGHGGGERDAVGRCEALEDRRGFESGCSRGRICPGSRPRAQIPSAEKQIGPHDRPITSPPTPMYMLIKLHQETIRSPRLTPAQPAPISHSPISQLKSLP